MDIEDVDEDGIIICSHRIYLFTLTSMIFRLHNSGNMESCKKMSIVRIMNVKVNRFVSIGEIYLL